MRVWNQWTDEHRTTRKISSGRRKVTSARDNRHPLCMAVNDRTASSRQLAARLTTATGSPLRQTIDSCVCNGLITPKPDKLIGQVVEKHQVVFSDESCFNLWDHEGRFRVMSLNAAFQSALSNDLVA
ncbi:transposable element Tcb2 transposase [Trichonephila clavipes]|nr:transposable element Tcb2 transposase [Trichonephila clavipes]